MTMTDNSAVAEQMRAEFEEWAQAHFVEPNLKRYPLGFPRYAEDEIQIAYEAFHAGMQAARAQGAEAEPVGWMNPHDGEVVSRAEKHSMENNNGAPGRKVAQRYSQPLYTHPAPQSAGGPDGCVKVEKELYDHAVELHEDAAADAQEGATYKAPPKWVNDVIDAYHAAAPQPTTQPDWTPCKDVWDKADSAVLEYLNQGGDDPVSITQIVWRELKQRPEPPEDEA